MVFVVCVAVSGFSQADTITNADLEKYRQKRLAAERELRENYRELGFPSPEELERRNEESSRELAERAARYRQDRLERERLAYENASRDETYYVETDNGYRGNYLYGYAPAYIYGGVYRYNNRRYRNPKRRYTKRGPGFISNPLIRGAWLRQSESMRRTYRNNFRKRGPGRRW